MIKVKEFLEVANIQKTGLGTTEEALGFRKSNEFPYKSLKVEISFGKGRATNIPWIAFLANSQKVQKGIYPVFLYYKDFDLLFLAYGVSENNIPLDKWINVESLVTIRNYFSENKLSHPTNYGSSYVYKVYNTKEEIDEKIINNDLNDLIEIYDTIIFAGSNKKSLKEKKKFINSTFANDIVSSGLKFSNQLITRFTSSLLTKPFVILTGLSGSGKTKLAQAFAMWLCANESQYKIVPVGADWTNREPLLGFPNALQPNTYVKPDSGVLDLIICANGNPERPYFLILDEMNLSHVERYFADFLSAMESGEEVLLHAGEQWEDVPAKIRLPKNLFIVGTVNIDETTYMFSPKVLDRASVIEFRVTAEEMIDYLSQSGQLNLDALKTKGAAMEQSFVQIATNKVLSYSKQADLSDTLVSFFEQLKVAGAEFGYRTASEIKRFAAVTEQLEIGWSTHQVLDSAIMQKLLPKLHGSRRKLEPVLKTLISLCISEGEKPEDYITQTPETDSAKVLYPVSLEKIQRMYRGLIDNGFTSYAEA